MIAKITNIPLGTRSQGWFGTPDIHDATIQADMKALGTLSVVGPGPASAPAKPAANATKPDAAPALRSTEPAKSPADAAPPKKEDDAPPVAASTTKENFPDMGLINQRYTLDMMGNEMQLQLRSWTSRRELRFAKSEPFKWKLKTWYVLKLRVDNQDGKALVRGKVWPRGEREPEKWTVEATDATPNTHGSPGLFGNSLNSEILIDNVKVYANEK